MKKNLLLSVSVLVSLFTFGQNNNCLTDSTSEVGEIINRLRVDGITGTTLEVRKTKKRYKSYRICERNLIQIDSLNNSITNSQIDSLFYCKNGTLKMAGFILFAKRNNEKASIFKKVKEILDDEYIVMTNSCSDAITINNIGSVIYDFLTQHNSIFKPKFIITQDDRELLKYYIANYEKKLEYR